MIGIVGFIVGVSAVCADDPSRWTNISITRGVSAISCVQFADIIVGAVRISGAGITRIYDSWFHDCTVNGMFGCGGGVFLENQMWGSVIHRCRADDCSAQTGGFGYFHDSTVDVNCQECSTCQAKYGAGFQFDDVQALRACNFTAMKVWARGIVNMFDGEAEVLVSQCVFAANAAVTSGMYVGDPNPLRGVLYLNGNNVTVNDAVFDSNAYGALLVQWKGRASVSSSGFLGTSVGGIAAPWQGVVVVRSCRFLTAAVPSVSGFTITSCVTVASVTSPGLTCVPLSTAPKTATPQATASPSITAAKTTNKAAIGAGVVVAVVVVAVVILVVVCVVRKKAKKKKQKAQRAAVVQAGG